MAIADSMSEVPPGVNDGTPADDKDNASIPAGYTNVGQFIDHYFTFDPASVGLCRRAPSSNGERLRSTELSGTFELEQPLVP
jgi:hypothetical protein